MTLGERISKLRKERKMSQEELAEILQVSRQAVSKWENGMSNPDTENLIRLSQVFDVDLNALTNGEERTYSHCATTAHSNMSVVLNKWFLLLMAVLFAAALCSALVFFQLWQWEIRNGKNEAMMDASIETVASQYWDSVKMYSGLLRTEVELSAEEEQELADIIWGHHYIKRTEEDAQGELNIYGGHIFVVEMDKGDIHYRWHFSEGGMNCIVSLPDGEQIQYQYDVELYFLERLAEFV